MRIFISVFGIVAGIGLILSRRIFARSSTQQRNIFGRANSAAGESAVSTAPVVIGVFLIAIGILAATGVVQLN